MITKIFSLLFRKDNWKDSCRSVALFVCSLLSVFCDDYTDKIITVVIAILTIDSFSKTKK